MDALTALQQRVSSPKLTEPAATAEQIETLIQAGLRAPDHASLRPYRFLVIEGEARNKFGDILAQVAQAKDPAISQAALEKARAKPLRAPTIIVAIASVSEHPKVPEIEQVITAGAAATNIVTAAFAMGLGAYWRTGGAAFDATVKTGLGLKAHEQIVGFIYLGTPATPLRQLAEVDIEDYCEKWVG